jgi:SAM-dependent methyltransferase
MDLGAGFVLIAHGVGASVGDCNFIQLQPEKYDLILCHSILHHVVNLEHLLHQLNAALKVGGILVVDEYVGPSRWQWPRQTCSFVNAIMTQVSNGTVGERRLLCRAELGSMIMWSPFESIRSSDIPGVLEQQFGNSTIIERRFMGFLYPALWTLDHGDWERLGFSEAVRKCIEIDGVVGRLDLLPPCFLFGIYAKSESQLPPVTPLKDAEVQRLLNPYRNASPVRLAKWLIKWAIGRPV